MTRPFHRPTSDKLRPNLRKFTNPDKPQCSEEYLAMAMESYHRISRKYAAKYSVKRDW